jgi:chromosome segregation ATPase
MGAPTRTGKAWVGATICQIVRRAVRYHFVNAMLLNEVQKQERQIDAQRQQLAEQARQMGEQAKQIAGLTTQARRTSLEVQQLDALTARLAQLEATVSAQEHAPAVEVRYRKGSGL